MRESNPIAPDGRSGSPRAAVFVELMNLGFGEKKDLIFYTQSNRMAESWDDLDKQYEYYQNLFDASFGIVYNMFVERKGFQQYIKEDGVKFNDEKDAREYALEYKRRLKQYYFGPGIAHLVRSSRRNPSYVLDSTLGWQQLQPSTKSVTDEESGATSVLSANFIIEMTTCPDFRTDECVISSRLFKDGPSELMLELCQKCKKHEDADVQEIHSGHFPKGISKTLHQSLMVTCMRNLTEVKNGWKNFIHATLGIHDGKIKAPDWDADHAGEYIIDSDEDPNKDWKKKVLAESKNPPPYLLPPYDGDYVKWAKDMGFSPEHLDKKKKENVLCDDTDDNVEEHAGGADEEG